MRKVINRLQKTIGLKVLCTLLIICCNLTITIGQYPVRSQITFTPPYSPNLSDYYTGTTERFIVTLTNTDFANPLRKVRLRLNIKSNSIILRSKDNTYYPIIELDAGIPTRLSLSDLEPYFNPNNIDASGIDYGFLAKSPRLPDGYYAFRFDVIDANTGQVLNNTLLGEQNIRITTNDPPLLNLPRNKDNIAFRDPTNIIFNWTPRHIGISSAEYAFSLYEINDNGMPPENAPFVSQPIYQTTSYTTTLLYGTTEPQLLPGKKYAWRIKATAMSGGDAYDLFRNNGYSETYWFQLNDNCPPIQQVAATVKNGAVTISWLDNPQMYEYTVEYRKVGNVTNRWFTTTTRTNRVVITNVSENNTYEYRVGGTCTVVAGPTFSDVKAFTIPSRDSVRDKQCGIMPNINLSNQTAIDKLNIGDIVNVGDFPVMIIDLTSTVGPFSGKGYITIPFLGDVRVKVKFDNVIFNTDKQLIQGFMVTTYDKDEKQIVDVDTILTKIRDILKELGIKISKSDTSKYPPRLETENTLKNVYIDTAGRVVIDFSDGVTIPLPKNIEDFILQDSTGKQYSYDKDLAEITAGNKKKNDRNIYFIVKGDTTKYRDGDYLIFMQQNNNIELTVYSDDTLATPLKWTLNKEAIGDMNKTNLSLPLNRKAGSYSIRLIEKDETLAKIVIYIYDKPIVKFTAPKNPAYDGSFGFDDGFEKHDNLRPDYAKLDSIKDYYAPVVTLQKNQTVRIGLDIAVDNKAINDKNFKIVLKSENPTILKINDKDEFIINNTNFIKTGEIQLNSKNYTAEEIFKAEKVFAYNNKNEKIGQLEYYCRKLEEAPIRFIYVDYGNGYPTTPTSNEIIIFLNNNSMNQLFMKFNLDNVPDSKLKLDFTDVYNRLTEAQRNEPYLLLDSLRSCYAKKVDSSILSRTNKTDFFFISNMIVDNPRIGPVGGIHDFQTNYGAMFSFDEPILGGIAHELGHKLNLPHTFCDQNARPCNELIKNDNRLIRKEGTKSNFMDYHIDRKNWFKYQILNRILKK